ncbi:MAG: hypothetical protein IKA83_05975 [Paludibacteraceae bacterium]|nr:hypothetical protein [Paludibacteraceae bacterium]
MGVIYDPVLGKLRDSDKVDLSEIENSISEVENRVQGTEDGLTALCNDEEKLIIENTNATTYITKNNRVILSMDYYNCSNALFNGNAVKVGDILKGGIMYNVTVTVQSDRAAIIMKTKETYNGN